MALAFIKRLLFTKVDEAPAAVPLVDLAQRRQKRQELIDDFRSLGLDGTEEDLRRWARTYNWNYMF